MTASELRIEGWATPEFAGLEAAFRANFTDRGELGAAVSVVVDGLEVASYWGGFADAKAATPWARDTLIPPASSIKGLFSIAVHKLVSDGRLAYDDLVTQYWPAFGANGKAGMTVRHLLGQTAGLETTFPVDVYSTPIGDLLPIMEAATPKTSPGSHGAYHSQTLMPLLAGLIFKVTGEEAYLYFRREIAGPWGIDAYLTLPQSEYPRAGETVIQAGTYYHRLMGRIMGGAPPGDIVMPPATRHLFPYASARAYARIWGGLANGGLLDGVQLFAPEIAAACAEPQWTNDSWYPFPTDQAESKRQSATGTLGFFRSGGAFDFGPGARTFGMPGAGGNAGFGDPDRRLGFGYVLNGWYSGEDLGPRLKALVDAVYGR